MLGQGAHEDHHALPHSIVAGIVGGIFQELLKNRQQRVYVLLPRQVPPERPRQNLAVSEASAREQVISGAGASDILLGQSPKSVSPFSDRHTADLLTAFWFKMMASAILHQGTQGWAVFPTLNLPDPALIQVSLAAHTSLRGGNLYLPMGVKSRESCIKHALPDIGISIIEGIRDKKLKERLHLRVVQTLGELVQGQSQATPRKEAGSVRKPMAASLAALTGKFFPNCQWREPKQYSGDRTQRGIYRTVSTD